MAHSRKEQGRPKKPAYGPPKPPEGPPRPTNDSDQALLERVARQGSAGYMSDAEQAASRQQAIESTLSGQREYISAGQGGRNAPLSFPEGYGGQGARQTPGAARQTRQDRNAEAIKYGTMPAEAETDAYYHAIVYGNGDKITEMSREEREWKDYQWQNLIDKRDERAQAELDRPLNDLLRQNEVLQAQQMNDYLSGIGPYPGEQQIDPQDQAREDFFATQADEAQGAFYDPETGTYNRAPERPRPQAEERALGAVGIRYADEIDIPKEGFGLDVGLKDYFRPDKDTAEYKRSYEYLIEHTMSSKPGEKGAEKSFDAMDQQLRGMYADTEIDLDDIAFYLQEEVDTFNRANPDNPFPPQFEAFFMEKYNLNRINQDQGGGFGDQAGNFFGGIRDAITSRLNDGPSGQ